MSSGTPKRVSERFPRWGAAALGVALCLCAGAPASGKTTQTGVVIALGDVAEAPLLETALRDTRIRWRLERLPEQPQSRPALPTGTFTAIYNAYLEADFAGCLGQLEQRGTRFEWLLRHGQRANAARFGVLEAACAYGAGEEQRAESILQRLYVRELDLGGALQGVSADVRGLALKVRSRVSGLPRQSLTCYSEPAGARVVVDGGAHACPASPCVFSLLTGEHLVVATSPGFGSAVRQVHADPAQPASVRLTLERATPRQARAQLATLVPDETAASLLAFSRLVALAYAADHVIVVRAATGLLDGWRYDRSRDRLGQRASAQNATLTSTAAVLEGLLGQPLAGVANAGAASQPNKIEDRGSTWVPWAIAGGVGVAAALTAVLVYGLAANEAEPRYDLVIR